MKSKAKPRQLSSRSVTGNKRMSLKFTQRRQREELPSTVAASIASHANSILRRHTAHNRSTMNFCYKNIFIFIFPLVTTSRKVCNFFSPTANALSCHCHTAEVTSNGTGWHAGWKRWGDLIGADWRTFMLNVSVWLVGKGSPTLRSQCAHTENKNITINKKIKSAAFWRLSVEVSKESWMINMLVVCGFVDSGGWINKVKDLWTVVVESIKLRICG